MQTLIPIPLRAIDALRRGDKMEAIRLLRAESPLDLKSARDAIEAFQRSGSMTTPKAVPGLTSEANRIVEQSVADDRPARPWGFATAAAKDALAKSRPRDPSDGLDGRSPGEMPRTGPLWWIVVLALAGYALYPFVLRALHV